MQAIHCMEQSSWPSEECTISRNNQHTVQALYFKVSYTIELFELVYSTFFSLGCGMALHKSFYCNHYAQCCTHSPFFISQQGRHGAKQMQHIHSLNLEEGNQLAAVSNGVHPFLKVSFILALVRLVSQIKYKDFLYIKIFISPTYLQIQNLN